MISIQNKSMDIPIIQGGMGVGVSLSSLAGHVAKCGGMGVISAAHPGYQKEGFRKNPKETNLIALKEHIQKAKEIAKGKGLVGVNIMVAGKGYDDLVNAAIDGGADAIISGAGLPLDLPRLAKNKILMAPIVSSARAIKLILKMWDKKHECTADFVVIEGSEAGGHLGFKVEDLEAKKTQSLEEILDEVKEEVTFYEEKYKRKIPLFVAGGINTGKRLKDMILRGASGAQIATPFIATYECDASDEFKQAVIDCHEEDIELVKSPTGFPGRAIVNSFVEKTRVNGPICMKNCLDCMIPCTPSSTPYCISEALISTAKGQLNQGLLFVGTQASQVKEMMSVEDLINRYLREMEEA